MASKRAQRRRQCNGKRRHASYDNALIAVRKLRQQHGHVGQVSPYHCKHCGAWHIGHTPGRNGLGSAWGR